MPEVAPVLELGVILLVAAVCGALSRRLGLPAVLGYLVVGLLIGPFTPGYVADRHQLQLLADFGVVLLLFEVGIELDPNALRREPVGLLAAAPLQVAVTTAVSAAVFAAFGVVPLGAAVLGLAVALSSAVVVINITRSRRRTLDGRTARTLIVWAILQDVVSLFAVGLLAVFLVPDGAAGILATIVKLTGFVLFAAVAYGTVVPWLLRAVRGQPDTFLIVAVSVALVTAGIGALAFSVPLALAAFVAGIALSVRREAQEARREVLPFRDLFAVMFFVAIGTIVDVSALAANLSWFLLCLLLVAAKSALVSLLAALLHLPGRSLPLGVSLGQIGEFSFVVLGLGVAAGVVTQGQFSGALAAAAVSIAASTVAARLFRAGRLGGPAIPRATA